MINGAGKQDQRGEFADDDADDHRDGRAPGGVG